MRPLKTRPLFFTHCRLALPDALVEGSLLAEDGVIAAIWIGEPPGGISRRARRIDCQGLVLAPGLIDIHNHGAVSFDFVNADATGNNRALAYHARNGVTSLVATVMTETHERMCAAIEVLGEQFAAGEIHPNFRGIHVEGPYFNPEKKGAHCLDCLRDPAPSEYEAFWKLSRGTLRIFTHAPERKGSIDLCRFLHARGCLPAIGHTRATMLEIRRASACGARHFVHANNAVDWPARRPRPEGWMGTELMGMGTLLTHSAFSGEIISDGYHVPVEMIRLFLAACGSDRLAIVSDASPTSGCRPGKYLTGGVKITLKPRRLALAEGGAAGGLASLGGSATTQLAMVGNYVEWGLGLATALKMSTWVPSRIIGESTRGLLRVGNVADLILIDDRAKLHATLIQGRIEHRERTAPM